MDITYDNMNQRMIGVVPAVAAAYQELVDLYEGDPVGSHVAYGLLNPHLADLLREGGHDAYLQPIFAFLEELAQHPDPRVVNVIDMTTIEYLLGWLTGAPLARAIRLMGPTMRKLADEQADAFRYHNEIRALLGGAKSS